ncbi:MAG: uroporphyrinogen decarboxylase/cobalamine-independent methonine synthase family protein [Thermincolia bacterium]
MSFKPACLATGVGSVPYGEANQAIDFVNTWLGNIPHWPQLALPGEQLINQYLSPLIQLGLVVEPGDKAPHFDTTQADWVEKLTNFYGLYLEAEETGQVPQLFAFPYESAQGFYTFLEQLKTKGTGGAKYLKGQVTGPVTLGLQLFDQDRRSAYYHPELRDIVLKTVALQARWQAQALKEAGLPVIMVIDEPGLYGYGLSTHITLNRDEIINELNTVIQTVKSTGALVGVHVCANTDWSLVLEVGIDLVSFDSYEYFQGFSLYASEIKAFLERGGVLAWGIAPTSEKAWQETTESLRQMFYDQVKVLTDKGIDYRVIMDQSLITPSCGTASLSQDLALKVYNLTQNLSHALRFDLGYGSASL